jgi:hypothetical protein
MTATNCLKRIVGAAAVMLLAMACGEARAADEAWSGSSSYQPLPDSHRSASTTPARRQGRVLAWFRNSNDPRLERRGVFENWDAYPGDAAGRNNAYRLPPSEGFLKLYRSKKPNGAGSEAPAYDATTAPLNVTVPNMEPTAPMPPPAAAKPQRRFLSSLSERSGAASRKVDPSLQPPVPELPSEAAAPTHGLPPGLDGTKTSAPSGASQNAVMPPLVIPGAPAQTEEATGPRVF